MGQLIFTWDSATLMWLSGLRTYDMALAGIWVSELGSAVAVVGIVAVVSYFLFRAHRKHDILGLIVSAGGATLAAHLMKIALDRPRPTIEVAAYIEAGSSFPSAHAAVAVGLYGFLAWLLWRDCERRWWHYASIAGAALLALAIGFSRIFLGVHYPSDVLAGYCLGGIFLAAGILVTRRWRNPDLC